MAEEKPFPREFYLQNTVAVARKLIGGVLVRQTEDVDYRGRIVETEAYRDDEEASHSYRGLTDRTRPMFEDGGIAYVYFIYGMYNCLNAVTEKAGVGCAVLIRAVEPLSGAETMWRNRFPDKPFQETKVHTLANGPGKLCRAMEITREDNGVSLLDGAIRILQPSGRGDIGVSRRIGIKKAVDLPFRFYEIGNPSVGRP